MQDPFLELWTTRATQLSFKLTEKIFLNQCLKPGDPYLATGDNDCSVDELESFIYILNIHK